jgi:adenylate cyclase class 2
MPSGHSKRETEIKLPLGGAAQGRRLLRQAGFRVIRRKVFEDNALFDTAGSTLRSAGRLLRLRCCGPRVLLTFKGPALVGRHKSRQELELEISDAATFAKILAQLGFQPTFRYQKFRTEYTHPRSGGLATLDQTPIGDFLELEGPPRWIDRTAAALGFLPADYITASYAGLYAQYRRQNPSAPPDMVFGA